LVRLIQEGAQALDARSQERLSELETLAQEIDADYGALYSDTYLEEVRAGWQ
jgi:hypothetical protein